MELELKKAGFDTYEIGGELTLTQEETAETIVPDYCPDIARIIETTGKVFLHSREMRDGRAEISGTVRVTVLYTPEGEGGIRTLEFAMPFTVETDGRSLPDCAALLAAMGLKRGTGSMLELCGDMKERFGEEATSRLRDMTMLNARALFSAKALTNEERTSMEQFHASVLDLLKTHTNWPRKLRLKWLDCLY